MITRSRGGAGKTTAGNLDAFFATFASPREAIIQAS